MRESLYEKMIIRLCAEILILFAFVFSLSFGCIGTGYTCDRGAIEIHMKVNKEIISKYFEEANVTPYGQTWGVKGEISIYYTKFKPILLYVFDNGIRIQIAVKNFYIYQNGSSWREKCEFYEDPGKFNPKEITREILYELKRIGAINIGYRKIAKIVSLVRYWGLAGNQWIDAEKEYAIGVLGLRGCGGGPIFLLEEWREHKEIKPNFVQKILELISDFLIKLYSIFTK